MEAVQNQRQLQKKKSQVKSSCSFVAVGQQWSSEECNISDLTAFYLFANACICAKHEQLDTFY